MSSAAPLAGIARALASTLLCPVTVVKTRMEYGGAGAVRYKDTWDALATIARAEGPRGLFRGLVPTVMTTAPFSGQGGRRGGGRGGSTQQVREKRGAPRGLFRRLVPAVLTTASFSGQGEELGPHSHGSMCTLARADD